MPKPLTMPTMPPGPRRDFVLNLFTHFKRANRPTLQQISDRIQAIGLPTAPGKETVRRMFRGDTVPLRWDSAYAVLLALCDLAGVNPDAEHEPRTDLWDTSPDPQPSHLEHYRTLWNTALDHRPPTPTDPTPTQTDPWADIPPPETEPDWLDSDDTQIGSWDEVEAYLALHFEDYLWLEALWDEIPPPETEPDWLDPDDSRSWHCVTSLGSCTELPPSPPPANSVSSTGKDELTTDLTPDLHSYRDEAEATRDEPSQNPTQLARVKVLSIRLNFDEFDALTRCAGELELPASVLVRSWILTYLTGDL